MVRRFPRNRAQGPAKNQHNPRKKGKSMARNRSDHDRKMARYASHEKAAGRPMRVPADEARAHRDALRALGMTDTRIAEMATENGFPMHQSTVSTVGLHNPNVHRNTANGILSIALEDAEPQPHKLVPVIGMQRIIGGLMCAGYSLNWLSMNAIYCARTERKKRNHSFAHAMMSGKFNWVELQTFQRTYRFAQKLEVTDPRDMGLMEQQVSRSKNYAAKHGYVPLTCWDEDTIMNPGAFPEWTGACGTTTGYNLHRKHDIHMHHYVDRNGKERSNVLCEACCGARVSERDQRTRTLQLRRDECAGMILDGVPYRVIAAELGMSTRTVQRVARELEGVTDGSAQGAEVDDS